MSTTGNNDIKANWRLLGDNAWWAISQTWKISRLLCGGLVATSAALESQQPDISEMAIWLALAAVMILIGNASGILGNYCRLRLGDELRLAISKQTFEHATTLDLAFFEDPDSQNILSRATQNPGGDFLSFVIDAINTFELTIQVISLLGVLIWIDPLVTPLLLALAAPWLLFRWRISKIRFATLRAKTTQRRWSRYYTSKLVNRLTIPAVKLFRLAPLLIQRFERTLRELMEVNRGIYKKQALGETAAALLFTFGFLLVVGLVGYRALYGSIPFNLLITYLLAAFRLRNSVASFINKLSTSMEKVLNITNLQEFLSARPTLQDVGTLAPPKIKGQIELRDVTFSYSGVKHRVLRDVNMKIQPGETVALVGPNGSGKTTLVKLITRLYELNSGSILIDGQSIADFSIDFLHRQIAYVDQHNVRFEATVHENIAFGDWRRLIDQPDQVRKIARETNIEPMIQSMPSGFETLLGRKFGKFDLSGGQWQKLAVARAVAKNASIYILDEPTAHLDAQSEFEIFSGLRDLVKDRTVILISHRFTTARMADRIYVMDDGKVVQQGPHDDLMKKGGLYRELYNLHRLSLASTGQSESGGGKDERPGIGNSSNRNGIA
jgi:ATP-binding cassette subfamily B protein